ncbi:MAG TPA: hypothetical protein VE623_03985 [Acidimicrobiales bacterium]|nr:hypothetical protein [Acidimicrobiales bacterium]
MRAHFLDVVVSASSTVANKAANGQMSLDRRSQLMRCAVTTQAQKGPEMILKDKVAVIYGAGGAIGSAVGRAFALEGARDVSAATAPGAWGSLPIVVITAGSDGDPELGEEVAALSEASRHIVADGSGHYVQYERPQVVVDAIVDVVERARTEGS